MPHVSIQADPQALLYAGSSKIENAALLTISESVLSWTSKGSLGMEENAPKRHTTWTSVFEIGRLEDRPKVNLLLRN